MLVQAHHASWGNPYTGDFAFQLEHVERGLSHYDPAEHSRLASQYGGHDAGVCAHCHRGVALWATGYPERSGESFAAALALADEQAVKDVVRMFMPLMAEYRRREAQA